MTASWTSDPLVLGLVAAAASVLVGWFGYRRSKKADDVTERIAVESGSAQSIAQAFGGLQGVIDGLNTYIALLRDDKRIDEEDLRRCAERCAALQTELNRMYRKYGDPNGNMV